MLKPYKEIPSGMQNRSFDQTWHAWLRLSRNAKRLIMVVSYKQFSMH
jgi:hypothetical protein